MKLDIRMAIRTALCCAIFAAVAPFSVPAGAVPITLATLVIYITSPLLGVGASVICMVLYIALGAAGLPVFSGLTGGFGVLLSPVGGFIIGYIPLAAISAAFARKTGLMQLMGFILGTVVLYIFGTGYYCFITDSNILSSLGVCVLPFIVGDVLKIAIGYRINRKSVHLFVN